MIARALSALGLMKRSEHEAVTRQAAADKQLIEHLRADVAAYEAKFKLAATDLAKQAEEIARLRGWKSTATIYAEDIAKLNGKIAGLERRIAPLRPDALLWRAAREKRAARKGSVS